MKPEESSHQNLYSRHEKPSPWQASGWGRCRKQQNKEEARWKKRRDVGKEENHKMSELEMTVETRDDLESQMTDGSGR